MVRGLYTAATGMQVQTRRMDVISNDLANSNTTAYRKDYAVVEAFDEVLMKRLDGINEPPWRYKDLGTVMNGAKVADIYTDFRPGNLILTGISNNLAINGLGFFRVETPNGERLTRDGSFTVNGDGVLVTAEGYPVLGENGQIALGRTFLNEGREMQVLPDGQVVLNTVTINTIDIVNVDDPQLLVKEADNLFDATGLQLNPINSLIEQGYLESSNVNPVNAMVDMISVSRAYEANQRMVQIHDELVGRAVNDVGKG
ncbi:flagellar hook-basal body protein [Candidatus Epulonipiscium viviparus]|uniref:flagellar hook-basal body protein n=1 Tax=Candidatus Epulonipiscium viviparus TaxID=420336 RepID=UPI000496DAE0|nr:flagellar hook-basal body protein [Candidatus Epulopiscium viviparus]